MKTKEQIKKWLIKNCVNANGDLDLSMLDFSDFEGNVFTFNMKVKKSLIQSHQIVGKDLFQHKQYANRHLIDYGNSGKEGVIN